MIASDWHKRQADYEEMVKRYTCPTCGKRCIEFTCFGTPLRGRLSHGQWYCSREHWQHAQQSKEDNNAHSTH